MHNKIIKIFGIILVGTALFVALPFTSYAYEANVTTAPATNISPMNATLNGSVNTGGVPGSAWFEYGTDTSFGSNSTSLNAANYNYSYAGNFSTNISGLTANTVYYFRAVALNSYGKVYGNVLTFATNFSTSGNNNLMSPSAITTSGTVLDSTSAQFNALILLGNSNNANSYFEWGTTVSLGNQTPSVPLDSAPAIRHTETISGLAPNTTYYFRAVAENSYGRSVGTTLSLITSPGTQNTKEAVVVKTAVTTNSSNTGGQTTALSTLTANVLGGGSFFPVNIFGWMILLILILILALLGKHIHREFIAKNNQHQNQPPHHS